MKTYLDCIPCFLKQALQTSRLITSDDRELRRILDDIGVLLRDIPLDSTPPEIAHKVYDRVRELTGVEDPYREIKRTSTEQALRIYPALKEMVARAEDPLLMAVRLAIIGNIIDLGPREAIDIEADLASALDREFGICDFDAFRTSVENSREILYLADNAAESVFDRLLIEQLKKPITYVVRERPIINDVTLEDARQAGIHEVASIVSSGCTAPGIIPELCSPEFSKRLSGASMIISKGQGNFEALSEEHYPFYFMLIVKCGVLARELDVAAGSLILRRSPIWTADTL